MERLVQDWGMDMQRLNSQYNTLIAMGDSIAQMYITLAHM